jgi:hypothetical protein
MQPPCGLERLLFVYQASRDGFSGGARLSLSKSGCCQAARVQCFQSTRNVM